MADFTGLPDAIDLGEVLAPTLDDTMSLVRFAALNKYTCIIFYVAGVLHVTAIPTTQAITDALAKPTAGL